MTSRPLDRWPRLVLPSRRAQAAWPPDLPAVAWQPAQGEERWVPYGDCLYDPQDTVVYLSGVDHPAARKECPDNLGLMVQPGNSTHLSVDAYPSYGADNGCYSAGGRFDAAAWYEWASQLSPRNCLFVCAPDVLGDATATWHRADPWLDRIRGLGLPVALVAQDGLERWPHVPWDAFDCLFVGGTTAWKLSPAVARLCRAARDHGLWTHTGRVNSRLRLHWAAATGVDSVDGTYLRYGPDRNWPHLRGWLRDLEVAPFQPSFFADDRSDEPR
jgi:hypothetical protein